MTKHILTIGVFHGGDSRRETIRTLIAEELRESVGRLVRGHITSGTTCIIAEDPERIGLIKDPTAKRALIHRLGLGDAALYNRADIYSTDARFDEKHKESSKKIAVLSSVFEFTIGNFKNTVLDLKQFHRDFLETSKSKATLHLSENKEKMLASLGLIPFLKEWVSPVLTEIRQEPEREWMDIIKTTSYETYIIVCGMNHANRLEKEYNIQKYNVGVELKIKQTLLDIPKAGNFLYDQVQRQIALRIIDDFEYVQNTFIPMLEDTYSKLDASDIKIVAKHSENLRELYEFQMLQIKHL